MGVVDGPLDEVGGRDVEALREGVEIELGVVVFFVIEVGVGVGKLQFGDGGEDRVDGEFGCVLGAHAQVLRRGWRCAKASARGLSKMRAQTWYMRAKG